jgi:propionyl-CoA carboxylase alpha chain
MICKLTTFGKTRQEAIDTAVKALDHYVIRGVTHNIPLLRDVLTEPVFLSGTFTTSYLPQTYPEGFKGVKMTTGDLFELASLAGVIFCKDQIRSRTILNEAEVKNQRRTVKNWDLLINIKGRDVKVSVKTLAGGDFEASLDVDGEKKVVVVKDNFTLADSCIDAIIDGHKSHVIQLIARYPDGSLRIRYKGTAINIPVMPQAAAQYRHYMKEKPKLDLTKVVISPMPGVVKSVSVEVGQMVGEGLECCVVEAMKMQNSMKASVTGKVKAVHVKPGDTVEEDQVMVELE